MDKLKISENGRYFVKEDGTLFTWLADTAWTIGQRMKWDDVEYYMEKRKSQGFTVLQIVALDPERDEQMRNPAGDPALIDNDLNKPNEAYFQYLDWILEKAEEYGFYVLLLPVWGQLVTGDNWMGESFEKTVTEENAFTYGKWIGERYKNKNHIVWCLGGDRQPIHKGTDYRNVWRRMAEGLAKGVTGKDAIYNETNEAWDELLITYHACHDQETGECSTLSYWTDEEKWIKFVMIQSGHGTMPKNYEIIQTEYNREHTRPVWDGEPAYEMMITEWPPREGVYHDSWMVRRRAYWSMFAGAFGHTYGHASVWCTISEKETDALTKYSWFQALEGAGAYQMKYVRAIFDSLQVMKCVPAQEIVVQAEYTDAEDIETELKHHIQVCADPEGKFICAYLPSGGSVSLNRNEVKCRAAKCKAVGQVECNQEEGNQTECNQEVYKQAECDQAVAEDAVYIWWFNPRDGKYYKGEDQTDQPEKSAVAELSVLRAPTEGDREDWILILTVEGEKPPVQIEEYWELKETEAKKVFEW